MMILLLFFRWECLLLGLVVQDWRVVPIELVVSRGVLRRCIIWLIQLDRLAVIKDAIRLRVI